jgi:phospholipid/cholesterol/gamma-HCH transport system substrate-binding protein
MGYTKLKVGITTIMALLVLFSGIFWLKSYNPAIKKVTLVVEFEDGRLITGGDPVQISGIKVGEVSDVSLSAGNRALVKFYMNYTRLAPDTEFSIADVGLMGDKALVIVPGSEPGQIDLKAVQHGVVQPDIGMLVQRAGAILVRIESIAADIDTSLDVRQLAVQFDSTLQNFNKAITLYSNLAHDTRDPLKQSLANLNETSNGLKTFVDDNGEKLTLAISSFQKTADRFSTLIDGLRALPSTVDTLSYYIESDEGTFSRLLRSGDLYEELRQTNAAIDSFVVDFKQNPGKYTKQMQFKVRLF